ncbi:MAG: hypothetical protein KC469_04170 [Flavobacteriaceae bacterium]|nr:hypothetical protein [Flavobacteriaceae bacterium]
MEHTKQKNWLGRNWPWLIPVGGCFTVILLFIFGLGAVIFGVTNAVKNSTPYEYAFERAETNLEVKNALGNNIDTQGVLSGNISLNNNGGEVDFMIPIQGSKGEGEIYVLGKKIDGEWVYEKLYVRIKDTGEEINLLDKALEGI